MTNKTVDLDRLERTSKDNLMVSVYQDGKTIYQADLLQKGWFGSWRNRVDLLAPIKNVDTEILKAEQKLADLKNKRKNVFTRVMTLIASVKNVTQIGPVEVATKGYGKEKPKEDVKYVVIEGNPKPENNHQHNKSNNSNNRK